MPSTSVATTSALTGPRTTPQMRRSVSCGSPASRPRSDGFVVTPSMIRSGISASMTATLAESTKSFIAVSREGAVQPAATSFARSPIPSMRTVTRSPGASGPTPDGVPVAITSPG